MNLVVSRTDDAEKIFQTAIDMVRLNRLVCLFVIARLLKLSSI